MLKRAQLAEHWQVTPQAVSKLRKRGCPMSSLKEADAWRARNISTGARKRKEPIPSELTIEDTESESMMAVEGRLHRPTVEKNLILLEQLTNQARTAVADALARGEGESARRWSITLLNVIARSAIVAKSLQELLERDEVTISMDEVHRIYIEGMSEQKKLVESAVDSLPPLMNPTDTDGCRQAFRDWYESTFLRSMYNHFSNVKIPADRWPQAALEREGQMPPSKKAKRSGGLAPHE